MGYHVSRNKLKWQKYVQKKMNRHYLAICCMYVCKANILLVYLP